MTRLLVAIAVGILLAAGEGYATARPPSSTPGSASVYPYDGN